MNSVIYNIPARLIKAYRGRRVIVRSHDASELVLSLSEANMENVLYAQLLSLDVETDVLARWEIPVAVDIRMKDPRREFPLLYNFSGLLGKHPVRVSIPVRQGFVKAVKLALALNFAVKLEVEQPPAEMVEELAEVLELYLHRTSIAQPVEYFHSVFLYFFKHEPTSLWFVQEEDPELFRFVMDDGAEAISRRLVGMNVEDYRCAPFAAIPVSPLSGKSECHTCEYLQCCGGYFKWPDKEFSCEGVKRLFGTLKGAAGELRKDLDAYGATAQAEGVQA